MKTAIVTGAGSGIGRAVALGLARHGYALVLCGRRIVPLDETKALCIAAGSPDGHSMPVDLSDSAQAVAVAEKTIALWGRVSVLVNNAGCAPLERLGAVQADSVSRAFALNAIAPALMIATVWQSMVKNGGGRIVNVSSMATCDPFPGFLAYAASKSSVNSLARSVATEGREVGIKGFAVAPGAVETAMLRSLFDESMIPKEACLTPDDVARVVVECALGRRDDENGSTIWLTKQG